MEADSARRRRVAMRCRYVKMVVRSCHKKSRCDSDDGGVMPSSSWKVGVKPAKKSCGAMPLDEDGIVIGVATTSSTSRGGRRMRQEDMVMDAGAAMASVHDKLCSATMASSSGSG
ncbi:uncharacterized protein [Triticum aestivum]|uniref:uncharacterized protein n=1 Tax=Triticum aestivum TaxID=4565 RepID=UPI001D03252C|nr:uncharacterized protein LOC123160110 [Triticum aestivum]